MASTAQKQLAGLVAVIFTSGGGTALWTTIEWYNEVNLDRHHFEEQLKALAPVLENYEYQAQSCKSGDKPRSDCRLLGLEVPQRASASVVLMNDPEAARLRAERDARLRAEGEHHE